jgi:hypothetical protein
MEGKTHDRKCRGCIPTQGIDKLTGALVHSVEGCAYQKGEGLGFSLATLLTVSDGEPPELDRTRLVRM